MRKLKQWAARRARTARIAAAAGLCAIGGVLAAHAQNLIYFEENGGGGNPRGLYNFDSTTGLSTLRTTVGGSLRFFSLTTRPSDGVVYGVHPLDSTLWTLDIDTGAVAFVAPTGLDTIADITFHSTGRLYGLGRNTSLLYAIDSNTGASNLIGNAAPVRSGLAFAPDGTLYGVEVFNGTLYRINPATAAPTLVGGSGPSPGLVEDATITPEGEMFLTDFDGEIYRVNLSNGARTLVGNTGMGNGLLGLIAAPAADPCAGNVKGDSNCDGVVNNFDIDCFVAALLGGQAGWAACANPGCDYVCVNDLDGNATVNNFDIDPFVACLLSGQSPCP